MTDAAASLIDFIGFYGQFDPGIESVLLFDSSNRRHARESLDSLHHEQRGWYVKTIGLKGEDVELWTKLKCIGVVMSGSFRCHLVNGERRQDGNEAANSRAY